MRWQGERESENIEDRRGMGGRGLAIGGGLGGRHCTGAGASVRG